MKFGYFSLVLQGAVWPELSLEFEGPQHPAEGIEHLTGLDL